MHLVCLSVYQNTIQTVGDGRIQIFRESQVMPSQSRWQQHDGFWLASAFIINILYEAYFSLPLSIVSFYAEWYSSGAD